MSQSFEIAAGGSRKMLSNVKKSVKTDSFRVGGRGLLPLVGHRSPYFDRCADFCIASERS